MAKKVKQTRYKFPNKSRNSTKQTKRLAQKKKYYCMNKLPTAD